MAQKDDICYFGESYLPVILGNGLHAHLLAIRLSAKYELCPILCGKRRSILNLLNRKCGFLQFSKEEGRRLCTEKLTELAASFEELSALLIPTTLEDELFLIRSQAKLESHYILIAKGIRAKDMLPLRPDCFLSSKKGIKNE